MAEGTRMLQRRATAAVWEASPYVLGDGEIGFATDTKAIKIGDGVNVWTSLSYAFTGVFLPAAGKSADSELLDGINSDGFWKTADATTTATADKLALRTANGRVKVATGTSDEDATTLLQMTTAISAGIIVAKQHPVIRTITASATLAATDVGGMVLVNHASVTVQVVATIPTNASVPIAVGSYIDIVAIGAGGVKITPAGGVTFSGFGNVFPSYHAVRLIKTATDAWTGFSLNKETRKPRVRLIRSSTTGYSSSWSLIPYNSVDGSTDYYNPDSEWFSIPGAGLSTARRILAVKSGLYHAQMNFLSSVDTLTYSRMYVTVANNSVVGGRILTSAPCMTISSHTAEFRLAAGEGISGAHLAPASSSDQADGSFGYPNDLIVTRLGD